MTVTRTVWNQIQSNDHRLMRKFHRWRAPRWLRILTILATRLGDGWLWYALWIVILILRRRASLRRRWRSRVCVSRGNLYLPSPQK